MPAIADEGVCIRRWDWSETSQTAVILTRDHGLVRSLAKGSKRDKAPFSGGIEALARGRLTAILKPAPAMAALTSWDLAEIFPSLRRSLEAFRAGMYIADCVQHMVADSDPHPALYDAVVGALRGLEGGLQRSLLVFQWGLLVETGYRPELERDAATGDALADAGTLAFDPQLGGLVASSESGWRTRSETVQLLRAIGRSTATGEFSDLVVARANRLLASYIRDLIGKDLPTMRPLWGEGLAR